MDGCMMENGWMEGGVNRGIKKWVENEWTDGWMGGWEGSLGRWCLVGVKNIDFGNRWT